MRILMFILTALITIPAFLATHVMADDEIYRWVDKDGIVHFGDGPSASADAEILSMPQTINSATQPSLGSDPDQPATTEPSYAQKVRQERAQQRAETEENKKIMAAACAGNQKILSELEYSPNIYVIAEDGTETRMDDNVRVDKVNAAKSFIDKNCKK